MPPIIVTFIFFDLKDPLQKLQASPNSTKLSHDSHKHQIMTLHLYCSKSLPLPNITRIYMSFIECFAMLQNTKVSSQHIGVMC